MVCLTVALACSPGAPCSPTTPATPSTPAAPVSPTPPCDDNKNQGRMVRGGHGLSNGSLGPTVPYPSMPGQVASAVAVVREVGLRPFSTSLYVCDNSNKDGGQRFVTCPLTPALIPLVFSVSVSGRDSLHYEFIIILVSVRGLQLYTG
jgi:hypothetical protein